MAKKCGLASLQPSMIDSSSLGRAAPTSSMVKVVSTGRSSSAISSNSAAATRSMGAARASSSRTCATESSLQTTSFSPSLRTTVLPIPDMAFSPGMKKPAGAGFYMSSLEQTGRDAMCGGSLVVSEPDQLLDGPISACGGQAIPIGELNLNHVIAGGVERSDDGQNESDQRTDYPEHQHPQEREKQRTNDESEHAEAAGLLHPSIHRLDIGRSIVLLGDALNRKHARSEERRVGKEGRAR